MKRLLLPMALLFILSCGEDDSVIVTIPNLTLLNYTDSVNVGGEARIDFSYRDLAGDITVFFVTEKFDAKTTSQQFAAADLLISGSQGSSYFTIVYPTNASIGPHSYEIWVMDVKGSISNVLRLTITVKAANEIPPVSLLHYPDNSRPRASSSGTPPPVFASLQPREPILISA